MADVKPAMSDHIEDNVDYEAQKGNGVPLATTVTGTVKLTEGAIIYVPAATADPQGTLPSRGGEARRKA